MMVFLIMLRHKQLQGIFHQAEKIQIIMAWMMPMKKLLEAVEDYFQ